MMLAEVPVFYAGGGFPWGLLIVGLIVYFLWRNGMFDGRGRFGHGPRHGGYDGGYFPAQTPGTPEAGQSGPVFRNPREEFEAWHREAHAQSGAPTHAPVVPPTPPTPPAPTAQQPSADGEPTRQ
jgi:hypothetical protein